jgi:outer membrane lipoprotein carrier protein
MLNPKNEVDTDFDMIRVGFRGPDLAVMELRDGFGQVTRLRFTDLERNPKLPRDLFEFVPPRGVDIIRSDPGSGLSL